MIPKFRAWDKENSTMLTWEQLKSEADFSWFIDENLVFVQFTVLKDTNGAEVYFNDIVEDEYGHRYEVVFEGDCLRCNGVRKIRGGYKPKNRWLGRGLKIIGNIYENPELLEVTE